LLGSAAMLLSFDVAAEAVADHDRWHTHEHLPERLSILGFLRGTRWIAVQGEPRYMVLYEVAGLSVLASVPYLERLNNPTPWTSRTMPHYRRMSRGFCSVLGSFGLGMGHSAALIRFRPSLQEPEKPHRWLLQEVLPGLPGLAGFGSAHLLQGTLAPAMTNEQRIRGADRGVDSALIVTGYDGDAVAEVARTTLGAANLALHGASGAGHALYRSDYSLARAELDEARKPPA
ncbi:MAG: hypothetical protein ACREUK_08825, partial [Burkholderiales bacterium]